MIEINFIYRILLQILASALIYLSLILEINYLLIFFNILIFLVLTNTLNFQDGEDLNVALLLIIIFAIFFLFAQSDYVQDLSKIILCFLISFSFFNIKKNTLYFGDSGCYFVSILILIFIYSEIENILLIKLFISVIIYPILDVLYVLIYRIFKKEYLLSRNYLHFYQIIAKKKFYKLYLLPTILFPVINIFISFQFFLSVNLIFIIIFINIFLLLLMRLVFDRYFNKKKLVE